MPTETASCEQRGRPTEERGDRDEEREGGQEKNQNELGAQPAVAVHVERMDMPTFTEVEHGHEKQLREEALDTKENPKDQTQSKMCEDNTTRQPDQRRNTRADSFDEDRRGNREI